jgi:hypothetical protein
MRIGRLRCGRAFVQAAHQEADLFTRQFAGRKGLRQAPLADDRDFGRNLENLVQVLADDDDGGTVAREIDERLPNAARRPGVDTPRRLVDDKHRGLAIELTADDELLQVAA